MGKIITVMPSQASDQEYSGLFIPIESIEILKRMFKL